MEKISISIYRGDGEFEDLIKNVFVRTGAGRVTLRMPDEDEIFPVHIEARREDVLATGDYAADPNTGTFQYLQRTLQPLVQTDTREAEHAAPPILIEKYGVGAQILAPIDAEGELGGIISVHHIGGARAWSDEEIEAATDAAATIAATLRRS
jgi:maleate isomerase